MKRLLFCAVLYTFSMAVFADDFAIVVGKDSPIDKLNEREVTRIFLAKTKHLRDNGRVTTHELSDDSTQEAFYFKLSGKSPSQINAYWTTLIFTGKGRPPKKVNRIAQLIEAMNGNPNAISYLPIDQITESMKVVHILR